jgi:uncharacterized protein YndB with AHSA1/START domain
MNSGALDLAITRVFNAPRELVFSAWTAPEHLQRWQGAPQGMTITTNIVDFRPGGEFRLCMRSTDGVDHWLQGVYREIVPPERIVFTHAWVGTDGKSSPETLVTITFMVRGNQTEMMLQQTGFTSAGARDGHGFGWNSQLDRFAEYLDTL